MAPNKAIFAHPSDSCSIFSDALESTKPVVVISTEMFQETKECIVELSEQMRDANFRLYTLTDIDKQSNCSAKVDDQWTGIVSSATANRSWVIIQFDMFWVTQISKILQLSQNAKPGLKIWILTTSQEDCLVPSFVIRSFAHVARDSFKFDALSICAKLKWLDSKFRNIFQPLLMIYFKFHVLLEQHHRASQKSLLNPSRVNFRLGAMTINSCITEGISLENSFVQLMESVYRGSACSNGGVQKLAQLWKFASISVHSSMVKHSMPSSPWSRDNFDSFLRVYKDELFQCNQVLNEVASMNIDHLILEASESILALIGRSDATKTKAQKSKPTLKFEVIKLLNELPSTINTRLLNESTGMLKLPKDHFISSEATKFLTLLKVVREDLIDVLGGFQTGLHGLRSTRLLDAIKKCKVPCNWIKYSHPTNISLSKWVKQLKCKVDYIEKSIANGLPRSHQASFCFSIRCLIQSFAWSASVAESVPIDQITLILCQTNQSFESALSESHLAIGGLSLATTEKDFLTCQIIVRSKSYELKESSLKNGDQIVVLDGFDKEVDMFQVRETAKLPLIVSADGDFHHYLEDWSPLNTVFEFYLDSSIATSTGGRFMQLEAPKTQESPDEVQAEIEENLLKNLELSNHVSIYLSFTSDTENEQDYLFELIFPALTKEFGANHVNIQFVNLGGAYEDGEKPQKRAIAACSQIARSHIFVAVYGVKAKQMGDIHAGAYEKAFEKYLKVAGSLPELEATVALESHNQRYITGRRESFFFFRDENFVKTVPKSFRHRYEADDEAELGRVQNLKAKVEKCGHSSCFIQEYAPHFTRVTADKVYMGGLEKLGGSIRAELTSAIGRSIMKKPTSEMFSKNFFGWSAPLDNIVNCLETGKSGPCESALTPRSFVIQGIPGYGKSAIISNLTIQFRKKAYIVLYSFVRSWPGSFDVNATLRRFCLKLMSETKTPQKIITANTARDNFLVLVREAVNLGKKIVVLIDSAERLQTRKDLQSYPLSWVLKPAELGATAFESIAWVFTTTQIKTFDYLKRSHPKAQLYCLNGLENEQKVSIIEEECEKLELKLDPATYKSLIESEASRSPLYLQLSLREARDNRLEGISSSFDFNCSTVQKIFCQMLKKLEITFGATEISELFCILSFCRNGLREVEIMDLLGHDLITWNRLFTGLEPYLTKSPTGFLMLYLDQFSAETRGRFAPLEADVLHYHRRLADYYIRIRDLDMLKGYGFTNPIRIIDIPYHLLKCKAPISELAKVLCSIDYITSAFECNVSHELESFFTDAIGMAAKGMALEIRTKLTEYHFFIERNFTNLNLNARLSFPLALDLPNGLFSAVKKEALDIYNNQKYPYNYLRCCSKTDDLLEMAPLGVHRAKIIYVGVLHMASIGKYCISVSSDGTVIIWNPDTYLKERELLSNVVDTDRVIDCCFSNNGYMNIAFGSQYGHIYIFNVVTGQKIDQLDNEYQSGHMLFSNDNSGIFRMCKNRFSCVGIRSSGSARSDHEDLNTHKILARSLDGSRIAILLTGKARGFAIIATRSMKEICAFKESNVSELSFGQFSYGNDVIALILTNGDIMAWRLDNACRISLIKCPSEKHIISIGISNDEKSIMFGTADNRVGIASLKNGELLTLLSSGQDPLQQISYAVSNGINRLFLASGVTLLTCFSQPAGNQSIQPSSTNPISLKHKTAILKVFWCNTSKRAITISNDGRIVTWCNSAGSWIPASEINVRNDITSARYIESARFLVLTHGNNAQVYDIDEKKELFRVKQNMPLKDAVLSRILDDGDRFFLYTWSYEGTVTAWEIVGNSKLFYSYNTVPLFECHATAFPMSMICDSGKLMEIINYTKVCEIDAVTGAPTNKYQTRDRSAIIDGCIVQGNDGNHRMLYATATALFLDYTCLSTSGSLGDQIQLERCKQNTRRQIVAYSGVEWCSSVLAPEDDHLQRHFFGIVTVLSNSIASKQRRICILKHEDCRVLQWEFFSDGKYLVTIAADKVIRVWDIQEYQVEHLTFFSRKNANFSGKLVCCFPMRSNATSLALSDDDYSLFVSDDNGEFLALKLELA